MRDVYKRQAHQGHVRHQQRRLQALVGPGVNLVVQSLAHRVHGLHRRSSSVYYGTPPRPLAHPGPWTTGSCSRIPGPPKAAPARRKLIRSLPPATAMKLIEPILADMAAITTIRRDIHAHPELCFQEERTADVIAKALTCLLYTSRCV